LSGGAYGSTGGSGGFTGIFDSEVTIIEGGTYNETGNYHTPGTPNNYPFEGPGFSDTVAPTNASEAVLIVGSGGAGENSNGAPAEPTIKTASLALVGETVSEKPGPSNG
jgi:hypothetical protein